NTDEAQMGTGGGTVQATNGIVTQMWTVANKIIFDADSVISQTPLVVTDKGYASGLIAYASIFKALAIGDMAMFWDHVPAGVGSNVSFVTANQGYLNATAVLNNAITVVTANPISTGFVVPMSGAQITNTLYALKARFSVLAGNFPDALAAANLVNLTVKSTFNYSSVITN